MATFTVDTLIDENDGIGTGGVSLRDAIEAANNTPGDDIIDFAPNLNGQTITLTNGQLVITSNLSIEGNGANITVDADAQSRVFNIDDGNGSPDQTVGINGLTITGGNASSGGGIYNTEILTINNSTIAYNVANNYAGIRILGGTANIANSTIAYNNSANYGGGIGVNGGGTANIANSTIAFNEAGIDGGGIDIFSGTANIANSTIAFNEAGDDGGGINIFSGTANIASTIIANNQNDNDIFGNVTSGGNNLIGNGDGVTGFMSSDLVGTSANPIDPLLGPLQNNGGPTETLALLPGSPAIDAGSNPNSLTTDQRGAGFDRVLGSSADIGAFEVQQVTPPVTPPVTLPPVTLPPVISIGILMGTQRDNLSGGKGDDSLSGFSGKDTIFGNDGCDTLNGGSGKDLLFGGNDHDLLLGGRGGDTLDGGQGDDTLEGGSGRDLFVLRAGDGEDTILDYSDGIDQFTLDGLSFDQLEIVQGDNGTLLQVDSTDEVLASLVGVDASVIDAGDFISI
ncbi:MULTISPECIES: choice-of-anchor Q domain-containing protein [unclassified Moorena]|uniref:choice-of-anchor Q domain-containing protein n=1 Tax=unclassified Moorena TaxID=2683338 RepID=UPI00140067C0|nr:MULTISPECIES: choice-of-anchor Q domain-containing protein [unclassified Moorena]NEO16511.1 hypothetical protein [Moorena sp. SIO3E8]NEQ03173.1 hypothetical protein [Moorena sp. SIO3F7]